MYIFDLDYQEIKARFSSWGEPEYRADQLWRGLYQNLFSKPDEFTNLPAGTRNRLGKEMDWEGFRLVKELTSRDRKTTKTLFSLKDGNLIETVLMRYGRRNTVCISTQAGCAMGCVFCATGQMGFKRNLTRGEIVYQVIYTARHLFGENKKLSNVVLMGMGEPFHNYENSLTAIDALNDPHGFNMGARRFTISTVGIVPMIKKFADEQRQVNLAISLHAADDSARTQMMPVNKRWQISEVLDACRYYTDKTGRRISFEWALIDRVNDTPAVAATLAERLTGLLCHVNAIPLNPTSGFSGSPASGERAKLFKSILENAGIPCTIRARRGIDIQAGCGQLAGTVI